jgi:adenylate cyclase
MYCRDYAGELVMKKWIISLFVILVLCGLRFADPWFLDMVRLKAMDQHQRNQETLIIDNVVTVEINNQTIRERGQWPWDRETLGKEIIKLYQAGAGLVVVPILFADPDRGGKDKIFADILKQTPTIIGQIPTNDNSATGVVRGVATVGADWKPWVYRYPGVVGPIPELAKNVNAVGMMVIAPEKDGVVRRMPLVVSVDGVLYPSISMEILRMAAGDVSFQMKTGIAGVEKLRIPKYKMIDTDANGNIWLDFQWKTKTYPLHEKLPDLTGKIVILSMTASGLESPVATPVGVIQSHDLIGASLATMMTGRNITRPFWTNIAELAVSGVGALILTLVVLTLAWYFGAVLLPLFLAGSFYGSAYLFTEYSYLLDWSYPVLTMFVVWAIAAFLRFMEEYKQKMEIKKQFAGYASPTVVRLLQENPSLIKDGMKKEISICFSDLRGFTPLGESFGDDVKGLTEIMNGYMDAITQPILDSNGMVIKYIGDASMHIHNAPIDDDDHPKSAVKTGLLMLDAVVKFNDKIVAEGKPPIGMGAGINTGLGYLGEMGSTMRHSYDVLGDAVSTAARIESKCKEYGCLLLVGEATYDKTKNDFFYLKVDELAVKGKTVGIRIYTVLSEMEWMMNNTNWGFAENQHIKMHEYYHNQHFDHAIRLCNDLMNEFDGRMKNYYTMWIERCEFMKTQPLEPDWNGVFIATTK